MRGTSLESLAEGSVDVPHHFRCPISLELMRDPVILSTGHTYDRSSIETWLSTGNTTCPVTRVQLTDVQVIPNHTLRRLIQSWCPTSGILPIPTPKLPVDSTTVRSLIGLASSESLTQRSYALGRLRRLISESDKNRNLVASLDATRILVPFVFEKAKVKSEFARDSLAVVAMLPVSQRECLSVANERGRMAYLTSLLFDDSTEIRVYSAAVIEKVVTGVSSPEIRRKITESGDVYEGVVGLINCFFSHPKAMRIGLRALLALCLVKEHPHKAVDAGAVSALIDRMPDFKKHDTELALAVVELLCGTPSGCVAFATHALTVPVLAKMVLRVSERATEFATGSLLAMCVAVEDCRKEAVVAGAVMRMLLVVQSKCTERAKRKAQALLKLLRDSWPEYCQMGSSDETYHCTNVVPF